MKYSDIDLSIIGEIGNVSVGGAATSLSDFINQIVTISIPETKIMTTKEIKQMFSRSGVFVRIDYTDGLTGSNLLLLQEEEAFRFVELIMKKEMGMRFRKWDEFAQNVMAEMFNIMVGSMSSSMSMIFDKNVKINAPILYNNIEEQFNNVSDEEEFVTVWFNIKIEDQLSVRLANIITEEQATAMLKMIKGDLKL